MSTGPATFEGGRTKDERRKTKDEQAGWTLPLTFLKLGIDSATSLVHGRLMATPAQCTTPLRFPSVSTTRATASRTASESVMSTLWYSAFTLPEPEASTSEANLSPVSGRTTSKSATEAPRPTSILAVAPPIPPVPPVTTCRCASDMLPPRTCQEDSPGTHKGASFDLHVGE